MNEQIRDAVRSALADVPLPVPQIPTLREKFLAWFYKQLVYGIYHWHSWRERRRKIIWRCVSYYGGSKLVTPRPMTCEQAQKWLARAANASVAYVDHETGHMFFKLKP
jgi:hypothetical protein